VGEQAIDRRQVSQKIMSRRHATGWHKERENSTGALQTRSA
jgi:hypothetical protein